LPTNDPVVLELDPEGSCRVELPVVPADARPFTPTGRLMDEPEATEWRDEAGPSTWRIVTDTMSGTSGIEASDAWGARSADGRVRASESRRYQAFISEADPLAAAVEGEATFTLDRPDVSVSSTARGVFECSGDEFAYDVHLDVHEGGQRIHERRWRGAVPRRLC
jgi:hypothetical protein